MDGDTPDWVEWAVVDRALPGQEESGDVAVVTWFPSGGLVAAIDGLGHGPEAARASHMAAAVLRDHAGEPPGPLVQRCHQRLRRTRGVVLSLAVLDAHRSSLTWMGIGNVEVKLFRLDGRSDSLVPRGGIVGSNLPDLRPATVELERGDLLVMATDGIGRGFSLAADDSLSVEDMAEGLLREHGKETDDALAVVVRYRGEEM